MLRLNELSHKNELGPILKILKRAFRWNQARFCGSIRLGAALDWIYMVSNDNCGTDVKLNLPYNQNVFVKFECVPEWI